MDLLKAAICEAREAGTLDTKVVKEAEVVLVLECPKHLTACILATCFKNIKNRFSQTTGSGPPSYVLGPQKSDPL